MVTKRLLSASVARAPDAVKQAAQPGDAELAVQLLSAVPGLSDTARRLLSAGVASFAERGYHGTTTRDIAARAGLSPAGLYVHYPSKSALLAHLSRLGHDAAAEMITRSLGPDGSAPPVVRLHRTVAAFVTWHAQHHLVARVVQYELRSLDDATLAAITAVRRRMEGQVDAVVADGVADGSLGVDHPRQATRAVLSLAVDVPRWFDPAGRESPEQLGHIYADLALRMLGAGIPSPKGHR